MYELTSSERERSTNELFAYVKEHPDVAPSSMPHEYFIALKRSGLTIPEVRKSVGAPKEYSDLRKHKNGKLKEPKLSPEDEIRYGSAKTKFAEYLATHENVTYMMAVNDNFATFVQACGGINNAKIIVGRKDLVHAKNYRGKTRHFARPKATREEDPTQGLPGLIARILL